MLATELGVTAHQISHLIRAGKIKATLVGHAYAISDEEAQKIIAERVELAKKETEKAKPQ